MTLKSSSNLRTTEASFKYLDAQVTSALLTAEASLKYLEAPVTSALLKPLSGILKSQ